MGKGLSLSNDSKGTHMVFTGGTGILVFIDIVAKIILGQLGIIPVSHRFHPDFKLRVFASF